MMIDNTHIDRTPSLAALDHTVATLMQLLEQGATRFVHGKRLQSAAYRAAKSLGFTGSPKYVDDALERIDGFILSRS